VQGVWFRDSTRRKALEFGVTGFVRNEPDDSVYIEAEGEEDALKKFVEWCQVGPERAQVSEVIMTITRVIGFNDFVIKR